jgi:hypothetical protein
MRVAPMHDLLAMIFYLGWPGLLLGTLIPAFRIKTKRTLSIEVAALVGLIACLFFRIGLAI